jgi:LysM repeat protein
MRHTTKEGAMPTFGFSSMGASVAAAAAGAPLLLAAGANGWSSYHVREGDTLWDIAAAHRTSVSTLVRVNGLHSGGDVILAGQTLRVPAKPKARTKPRTTTYTVKRGDTVSHIALRLGVPISRILADNHLDRRGRIYAGQHLKVPAQPVKAQAKAARAAATGTTVRGYTVRAGDTVSAIAVRLGSTVAGILKANDLPASGVIMPGQRLRVPVRSTTSANSFAGRTYPDATVQAAQHNRSRLSGRAVPSRDSARRLITQTARRYGVDPALALAVAYQESGFNQRQVSVANAIGIMQVIPSSGRWASDLVGRRLDLLDAKDNVTAGVVILKALTRAASSRKQAIASYYQGLSSVREHGMFVDTKAYVRSIEALVHRFD